MHKNVLRAPLIKSATLLAVISLLVYLTATSSEGSLWSSLGTLFIATFRIIQLGLGLMLALFFCLVVLSGIYLGCVAMVSRENAANMVGQLRQKISDKLLFFRSLVIKDDPSRGVRAMEEFGSGMKKEVLAKMEGSLGPLRQDQALAAEKIDDVAQRLARIESGEDIASLVIRLDRLEEQIQGLVTTADQFRDQVQEKMNEQTGSSPNEQFGPVLASLDGRMGVLEKTMNSLWENLNSIRDTSEAQKVKVKRDNTAGQEFAEHRLFAHLESEAIQAKIEQLVTETLDRDMSYAQVVDHLVAHTKGKTADIISAHPSLAKDYIRYRRKNG